MKPLYPLFLASLLVACGGTPPEDDDGPPTMPTPCEARETKNFTLGIVIFENPRWFRPFDEECQTIELQSGLQGGWHIEPALQAPRDASVDDLGGEMRWEVRNRDDNIVATAQFELFRNFWQELEGGNAYWGDFVIFNTSTYPEDLVDTDITVEVTLDFDEDSALQDVVLTKTVRLVDDET
jgi:hypothetical protein